MIQTGIDYISIVHMSRYTEVYGGIKLPDDRKSLRCYYGIGKNRKITISRLRQERWSNENNQRGYLGYRC